MNAHRETGEREKLRGMALKEEAGATGVLHTSLKLCCHKNLPLACQHRLPLIVDRFPIQAGNHPLQASFGLGMHHFPFQRDHFISFDSLRKWKVNSNPSMAVSRLK